MTAWLLSLMSLALVMSVTPGPNNVLFAASGSRVGYLRTLPTMAGMVAGFALVIVASGLGVGAVVGESAAARVGLTLVAAAYMTWIGVKLWSHAPRTDLTVEDRPVSPLAMLALQGINPKTWLASVAFVSGFLGVNSPGGRWSDLAAVTVFLGIVTCSASLWTLAGRAIRTGLSARRLHWWNRSLAVLSLGTALSMVLGLE